MREGWNGAGEPPPVSRNNSDESTTDFTDGTDQDR
jgi:hypothetical protein